MEFLSQRLYHTKGLPTGDYSCAFFTNKEESFRSFILEDTAQDKKLAGITRIAAGRYPLRLRKELTPLTKIHRAKYMTPWFKAHPEWWHIEICNVPDYNNIYYHGGNDDADTLGCQLPNYAFNMTLADNQGSISLLAVDKFYSIVHPLLENGEPCFVEIRDEIKL